METKDYKEIDTYNQRETAGISGMHNKRGFGELNTHRIY